METKANAKISPSLIQVGDHIAQYSSEGLTKREYFASRAPDFVFNERVTVGDMKKFFGTENYHLIKDYDFRWKASRAVAWADALIQALNENKAGE